MTYISNTDKVSDLLRTSMLVAKHHTVNEVKKAIGDFMLRVKRKYPYLDTRYDLNPIISFRNGRFTGRCTFYVSDIRVHNLLRGFTPNGEKKYVTKDNPKSEDKEIFFNEQPITILKMIDGELVPQGVTTYGKKSSLKDDQFLCWLDMDEAENLSKEKYGPDSIKELVPDIILPHISGDQIKIGPYGIDERAVSGKDVSSLFAQGIPNDITEKSFDGLLKLLCEDKYTVEITERYNKKSNRTVKCAKITFESFIDPHRVMAMMCRGRGVTVNGKKHCVVFNYFFSKYGVSINSEAEFLTKYRRLQMSDSQREQNRHTKYPSRSASPSFYGKGDGKKRSPRRFSPRVY